MSWERLEREIGAWAAAGREATLWWRDDDAAAATAALERLLDLTGAAQIPVALAVIPAQAQAGLAASLADRGEVAVLQHGFAHRNHAAPGSRAVECGGERPLGSIERELELGCDRLAGLFERRFLPVLVPPWNRIQPSLIPRLSDLGFIGLSAWGPREGREAAPRLCQVHTHADPIAWRRGRGFGGADRVTEALAEHLEARRAGRADPDEPTGLLTHHLVHDEAGWEFLAQLSKRLAPRRGLRWLSAGEAFA